MSDHVSMDIHDNLSLADCMKSSLEGIQSASLERGFSTIYQVSSLMKDYSYLYEPRMVAIGPYHRGKEKYRATEELKLRFIRELLDRITEVRLEDYISVMKEAETKAREYYDESIRLNSDDFVRILVVDGCFILGLLLNFYLGKMFDLGKMSSHMSVIRSDILLLENQLPFFVIQNLWRVTNYATGRDNLLFNMVYEFFKGDLQSKKFPNLDPLVLVDNTIHLLDLFHRMNTSKLDEKNDDHNGTLSFSSLSWLKDCCLTRAIRANQGDERLEKRPTILSATWLVQAGIKFKNAGPSSRLFDVVFEKDTLYVPSFRADSEHMTVLANFMVFEQRKKMEDRKVSSYVFLMDSLIDTADDVELLKGCGVMSNSFESNQAAATAFNSLGAQFEVDPKKHYYAPLFKKVSHFYISKWNRSKASFLSKYFDSPWAGFSLGAASVLLIFTGLQTYYTVAGYYHQ